MSSSADEIRFHVVLPSGSVAKVAIPSTRETKIDAPEGAVLDRKGQDATIFNVGGGDYTFTASTRVARAADH